MTAPLHSSEWLDEALHLYLITAKMRTEGDYWNDPAFKKVKQAIQEALVEAYEKGRKAGVAENQLDTINRVRKMQGQPPLDLSELDSTRKQTGGEK